MILNYKIRCSTAISLCAPHTNKTNPRENLEFVLFLQEIISDLKSDDDNITNFNRVLRALGFYIAGHNPR